MQHNQHPTSETQSAWPIQRSAGNPIRPLIVLFGLASLGTVAAFGWFRLGNAAPPEPIASPPAALNQLSEFFRSGSDSSSASAPSSNVRLPNAHVQKDDLQKTHLSQADPASQSALASQRRASRPKSQPSPTTRSRAAQLPAPIFATRSPSNSTATFQSSSSNLPQATPQPKPFLAHQPGAVPLALTDAIALYWSKQTPLHSAQWSRIQHQKPLEPSTRSLSAQLKLHLFPAQTPALGKLSDRQWQQLATQTPQIEQELKILITTYEMAWLAQARLNQATAALQAASAFAPQQLTTLKKQYQQAQKVQAQAQQQLLTQLGLPTDVTLAIAPAALHLTEPPAQNEQQAIQSSLQLRYDYLWLSQSPDVSDRQRLDKEKQIAQTVRTAIAQANQDWQTLQQQQQQQRSAEYDWRLQASLPNMQPDPLWEAYQRWDQRQTQTRQAQLQYHRSRQRLAQAQGRLLDDWGLVVSFRTP